MHHYSTLLNKLASLGCSLPLSVPLCPLGALVQCLCAEQAPLCYHLSCCPRWAAASNCLASSRGQNLYARPVFQFYKRPNSPPFSTLSPLFVYFLLFFVSFLHHLHPSSILQSSSKLTWWFRPPQLLHSPCFSYPLLKYPFPFPFFLLSSLFDGVWLMSVGVLDAYIGCLEYAQDVVCLSCLS